MSLTVIPLVRKAKSIDDIQNAHSNVYRPLCEGVLPTTELISLLKENSELTFRTSEGELLFSSMIPLICNKTSVSNNDRAFALKQMIVALNSFSMGSDSCPLIVEDTLLILKERDVDPRLIIDLKIQLFNRNCMSKSEFAQHRKQHYGRILALAPLVEVDDFEKFFKVEVIPFLESGNFYCRNKSEINNVIVALMKDAYVNFGSPFSTSKAKFAEAMFQKYYKVTGDWWIDLHRDYFIEAIRFYRLFQYEKAMEMFSKSLQVRSVFNGMCANRGEFLILRLNCVYRMGDKKRALRLLKEIDKPTSDCCKIPENLRKRIMEMKDLGKGKYGKSVACRCSNWRCAKVEKKPREFRKCGNCKMHAYCSVECQKVHWKNGHKEICKRMSSKK